jgi:hypothetical protein
LVPFGFLTPYISLPAPGGNLKSKSYWLQNLLNWYVPDFWPLPSAYRDGTSNSKGTSYEIFSYTKPPHINQPYLGGSLASQPQLSKKNEYYAHTRFLINATVLKKCEALK